jgi:hypothetical protein
VAVLTDGHRRVPATRSEAALSETTVTVGVPLRATFVPRGRETVMEAYVHALAAERDALLDLVEDAESAFMEFGIAPDVGRPTALSATEASEHAQTSPADASTGGWLSYLTPTALEPLPAETQLHYVGVGGMAVTARVVREATGRHPDVVLQSHVYTDAPREYAVYRYDATADEFTQVARGDYA